jgi:hypothetical protein
MQDEACDICRACGGVRTDPWRDALRCAAWRGDGRSRRRRKRDVLALLCEDLLGKKVLPQILN